MKVQLLGAIEVTTADASSIKISAAKARWLLVFLALDPGRGRSVASIIDALWRDRAPSSAPNLVQGYVSDLRKLLGHGAIQTTDHGYALLVDPDDVDIAAFRRLTTDAHAAASSNPELALAKLDEAIALGSGLPFGETAPDGPLSAAAAALAEQQVDARELRATVLLDLGEYLEAVLLLETLTGEHPYREGLWAMLARALYRSDRQVDALRRLATARALLQRDLGVSPGPTLVDLERQILDHNPLLTNGARAQAALQDPSTIVGREPERARFHDRLRQAAAGAQKTVFVGGEPGIGKTTLTKDVSRSATSEPTVVLIGRCDEHVAVPYRPFIEAIADHLREIGDEAARELLGARLGLVAVMIPTLRSLQAGDTSGVTVDPAADLSLLERFDTFCWLLRQIQGDRRLVLILEDLHWADSATLRLTHYLAAGHRLPSSLTIGTHRTTERADLLDDILADLRTEPTVERMLLSGLDQRDLLHLMTGGGSGSDDELAGWIYRETDGNPFLAVEIIAHIARTGSREGVPIGVVEVVSRRLRRLSPETQLLLEYAAVLGETGPISLLRQLAGIVTDVPSAVGEAVRAGILAEEDLGEPRYRFAHAITRKAAQTGLTTLRLEDLHIAAAEAWNSLARSDDVVIAMASHYLAAGTAASGRAAAEAFIEAGAASDRTGAKVEAVQWYDRAIDHLPDGDPRRARLRLQKFVAAQVAWHWLHGDYGTPDPN